MLIEFTVENFRSFKEKQTFSLLASKDKDLIEQNSFKINKYDLLKTAIVYGANASGKSTLFMALTSLLEFSVLSGPRKQKGDPINISPFMLDVKKQNKPSFFEIIFMIDNKDSVPIRYRYGIKLDRKHVLEEYLFAVNKTKEVNLFDRIEQSIKTNKMYFPESENFSTKIVRDNASYLSVCAQNNGEISGKIIEYFKQISVTSGIDAPPFITMERINRGEDLNRITKFLQFADIQVQGLKKQTIPVTFDIPDPDLAEFFKKKFPDAQNEQISYAHNLYDGEEKKDFWYFPEEFESLGTRKLFNYAGIILPVLDKGGVLFIDEFDSSLHPLIVENIIRLFNDKRFNRNNAQLIVSCQSVSLMTNKLFRRDQIWLCEKDRYGASEIYSLMDFEDLVRKDANFNKNYLAGKYGAVPNIDVIRLQMEK